MKTIEEIILQHSGRGMDILQKYLPADYCMQAAQRILALERGTVIFTTGFYVHGHAETDGPAGTFAAAKALKALGFSPVILTDALCRGFFEPEGFAVEYMGFDDGEAFCRELLNRLQPVLLFSIERCGINVQGDYANMRGTSIRDHTAPADLLFTLSAGKLPSLGVGDGGNEIGMGKLKDTISRKLSLVPCRVDTDMLVIASVSNWGAYGVAAALQKLCGMPLLLSPDEIEGFILRTLLLGSVDGISGENVPKVDGFGLEIEKNIVSQLHEAVR